MELPVIDRVRRVNAELALLLRRVGETLAGRSNFALEDVRAIAKPVTDMAPIVSQAPRLRAAAPELRDELAIYAQNLGQLNAALERVRFLLLVRSAHMEAQRAHLETVGLWAAAWQKTR